uniref:WD repeat domain-containing protein 83 n=1 Tax=Phasianus colchicus TaxID=9054 RepID=A0A669QX77_PHACC
MAFPRPRPARPELPRKHVRTIECGQGAVRAVRFNVDGNYCLTCGSDKTLKLTHPMCLLQKVNCVQFNEEATIIVSGSIDSTVRCWDCRSRRPDPVQVLDEAKDGISSLKLSASEILTGSVDGRVRRYDLRAGQLYSDYVGSPITSVCFSKDGQCVLAASLDSTLRLLDKETGEMLGEYTGHRSTSYRLDCVLSEQDTHVGSASEDGNVYFWDLVEGSLALTLPVGRGVVQSIAFHPTLPCLLAATEGCVQLWREDTLPAPGGVLSTPE